MDRRKQTILFALIFGIMCIISIVATILISTNSQWEQMWYYVKDGLITAETDLEAFNAINSGHTIYQSALLIFQIAMALSVIFGILLGSKLSKPSH